MEEAAAAAIAHEQLRQAAVLASIIVPSAGNRSSPRAGRDICDARGAIVQRCAAEIALRGGARQ
jgi:hypothetical protein